MKENWLDLSVIIITFNEEKRLPRCLASLPPACEVIVVDSFSCDHTQAIAQEWGAKVYTRAFDNYAEQKNIALSYASRSWVLSLDADEQLSEALRQEISQLLPSEACRLAATVGFKVRRKLWFLGKQLHFGKTSDRPLRLFRREQGRFERSIHEKVMLAGPVGQLKGLIYHHSYDDLSDYFRRFNDYTSRVAYNHWRQGQRANYGLQHTLRPWGEFIYRYFVKCGFLDGYPGYCYALISSLYAFIKYAKLNELCSGRQKDLED